jgi:CDP-paratose 2-epimerase
MRFPNAMRETPKPILITGGAGFIGTNLANRLLEAGQPVLIFDDLSRSGVEHNLQWLVDRHGSKVDFELGDIRNESRVLQAVRRASGVFHFAAQVAVTTSVVDPRTDFEINARGTLNVLEALRTNPQCLPLVFTSTNKVYGDLGNVELRMEGDRYAPVDENLRCKGVGEDTPPSFHSPYGCSKGAADQYVLDYARCYGLPACVFRMSCIYGPHQFGTEDQGWVAHFLLRILTGESLSIYGDGRQVRDLLFVEDLVNAFLLAFDNIETLAGNAFNIGGGPRNSVSLRELLALIARVHEPARVEYFDWRVGDQKYYVSNTSRFERATGWKPGVSVEEGVTRLLEWLREHSPIVNPSLTIPVHSFASLQEGAR